MVAPQIIYLVSRTSVFSVSIFNLVVVSTIIVVAHTSTGQGLACMLLPIGVMTNFFRL